MFAVFCFPKRYDLNRMRIKPCLDPLDLGDDGTMEPQKLLRRNRVGLFATREQAEAALARTGNECAGQPWTKTFGFVILECVNRSNAGESTPQPAESVLLAEWEAAEVLWTEGQQNDTYHETESLDDAWERLFREKRPRCILCLEGLNMHIVKYPGGRYIKGGYPYQIRRAKGQS